jgi:hypothetical protein
LPIRHAWVLAALPVWLGARTVAYALAPANPLARELEGRTGGSVPLLVMVVALGAALALAAGILGVASLAVRERAALAGAAPPPLRWRRLAVRGAVLFAVATVLFAGAETWLHMRSGLGFHGWHCLLGPVHRDALPFLAAFSAAATLVLAAVERLVAWARRIVRALRIRAGRLRPAALPRPSRLVWPRRLTAAEVSARAPPLVA